MTCGVLVSFVLLGALVLSMDCESANPGGEHLAQHLRGALGLAVHSTEYMTAMDCESANLGGEHLVQHLRGVLGLAVHSTEYVTANL